MDEELLEKIKTLMALMKSKPDSFRIKIDNVEVYATNPKDVFWSPKEFERYTVHYGTTPMDEEEARLYILEWFLY